MKFVNRPALRGATLRNAPRWHAHVRPVRLPQTWCFKLVLRRIRLRSLNCAARRGFV
jgi:hypothetical protein